jgi:hypothetical protein
MNRHRFLISGLMALFFLGSTLHVAASTIKVTFTNHSGYNVAFFLNGGRGLEARLKNEQSSSYTMTVDRGGAPEIRIHQVEGPDKVFSLEDKGRYVIRMEHGKIVNAYE